MMVAALLVEYCCSHQTVRRWTVRIESTLADHRFGDVLSYQIAAVTTADFRLQEEVSEAIKLHLIPARVVLALFNDRNDHHAAPVVACVRRRLDIARSGLQVLVVVDALFDVRVRRHEAGIKL